ncbi:hypothetical protein MMARJ_20980 [Mycobacterium marseillense]|uniref:DUF4878 domain-containing protein n=1 Tax=Mycobacterium marseillense TaxID=701042 RepID=A0ABM7JBT6_9MYCO|nr:hypothetical protein MMARJ_20980 [Mycobacterium marseillense]
MPHPGSGADSPMHPPGPAPNFANGPQAFSPMGFPPPGGWRPPPKRRKPLVITLVAGVAVLVTVGVVLAIVLMTGNGANSKRVGNGSAGDVVKTYLEALAKGDADTALGLAAGEPASNEFLTKEMLKQQIDHWPIKNIAILEDSSKVEPGDFAIVKAAADFGDNHSQGQIQVRKSDGVWKMVSSAINISGLMQGLLGDAAGSLTILGKPLAQGQHAYVFPGYLGISSVRYVDVIAQPVLLESLLGDNPALINVAFSINDAGHAAITAALETWLNGCLTAPDRFFRCPTMQRDTPINPTTAKITGPIDFSGLTQNLMPMTLSVLTTGIARYNATAQTSSGTTANFQDTVSFEMAVNLTKEPPTVGPLR